MAGGHNNIIVDTPRSNWTLVTQAYLLILTQALSKLVCRYYVLNKSVVPQDKHRVHYDGLRTTVFITNRGPQRRVE